MRTWQVGDIARILDSDGEYHLTPVVKIDDNHWVYVELKDEDGVPYQFKDIDAALNEASLKSRRQNPR